MFKKGDAVFCINNEGLESVIELNKIYIVKATFGEEILFITCYKNVELHFPSSLFVKVNDLRKEKLRKICLNQVTK